MQATPSTTPSSPLSPAVSAPSEASITKIAQGVLQGGLAVVPTETVYGVAVNLLSVTGRAAARAMKQTPVGSSPGWVLHVSTVEELLKWIPSLSGVGRRLVTKSLPGPIAFQVKLSIEDMNAVKVRLRAEEQPEIVEEMLRDGFLTVRVPENRVAADLIGKVGAPVAIFAARGTSEGIAHEVGELALETLGAETVGILDGGATRYRKASTLVRIEGERFTVVRSGVIDERIVEKFADEVIVFVCSGNTCRSPMAMALARMVLAEKYHVAASELPLRHVVVQSAGVSAGRGMRATREALEAVKELGGDLSSHQSQPASVDLLRRADAIYTMTNAHRQEVLRLLPSAASKTSRLDPAADIEDPIGSGLTVYKEVAAGLLEKIRKRLG